MTQLEKQLKKFGVKKGDFDVILSDEEMLDIDEAVMLDDELDEEEVLNGFMMTL